MKNKLTVILVIALIALVAGNYLLGADYLRQNRANAAMTANITAGNEALAGISPPAPDLATKLAEAEETLAAAQRGIPQDPNSTSIINTILQLAESCQVKAIPLAASPWARGKTEQDYHALNLSLSVSGAFANVASFIGQLENGELESLVVENLLVNRAAGEDAAVTTSLDVTIYARMTAPGKGELP